MRLGPRALVLGLLVSACASSGSGSGRGQALRVTLYDYASSNRFELVSESHTDRLGYYSTKRDDGARKIQADNVMDALVEHLDEAGFRSNAQEGGAPNRGGAIMTRAFEIERAGHVQHWPMGKGVPQAQHRAFNRCMQEFLDLYSLTQAFQVVENPSGRAFFDDASSPGSR